MKKAFEKLPPERRAEILDAAIDVFAEKGFAGAGISGICARAGVSNGALYKYFENKDDLFVAVAGRGASLIDELYRSVDKGLPARDYFRALFGRIRSLPESRRGALRLYAEIGSPSLNRFAEAVSGGVEETGFGHVRAYLEGARGRGELPGGIDLEAAVLAVDNLIMLYGFAQVSEYHRRRIASLAPRTGGPQGRGAAEDGLVEFLLGAAATILS